MFAKTIFLLCAQLLLVKSIMSLGGCGCGCGCGSIGGSSSGNRAFIIESKSPITPSGLYVLSENKINGQLAVAGKLPFLGAVELEGCVPDEGCSAVSYSCGNCVGIDGERGNAGAAGIKGCCGCGGGL